MIPILTTLDWDNYTPQQQQDYRDRLFVTRPNDRHVCTVCGETISEADKGGKVWVVVKYEGVGSKKKWVMQPDTSVCTMGGDHTAEHTPWVIDGEKVYLGTPAMLEYQAALLAYFRLKVPVEANFPHFKMTAKEREDEFRKFLKARYTNVYRDNELNQSMAGIGLAWVYHPHHWRVQCNKMKTPMEVFESDELFPKAIIKRMRYGTYISEAGIRKALGTFTGTQRCSNFRPTAAAAIYDAFLPPEGGVVWDPSCGFGGRLLGAMLCAKVTKYLGTDPASETFRGLEQMRDELLPLLEEFTGRKLVVDIHQEGSEVPKPWIERGSVQLVFTSPPYFDTEKYSDEESQSYKLFPTRDAWLHGFMKQTLANAYDALCNDGTLVINLANVKSAPDLAKDFRVMAEDNGWVLVQEAKLLLAKMMGTRNNDDAFKAEPVFIFKKKGQDANFRTATNN